MDNRIGMFLSVWAIIVIIGCSSSYSLMSNEYVNLYDRSDEFQPEVYVRQYHPDSAYIYVTFKTKELLYKRAGPDAPFKARMSVITRLSTLTQTQKEDSLVQYFVDERQGGALNEKVFGRFSMAVRDTVSYRLSVDLTDMNAGRGREEQVFLTNQWMDQRYMDIYVDGSPSRYCACEASQKVQMLPYWKSGQMTASIVDREWSPAALPFSVNLAKEPMQSERINLSFVKSEEVLSFVCPAKNTILLDTQKKGIWPIPVFRSDFPNLETYASLTGPLRYITTNDEYDKLKFSVDQKKVISDFWLDCASDPDRATSLMRAYYKRSEEANLYFSDFNGEGWMSDRGLVYIVFGPPSRVVLDGNIEIWFFNSEQAEYGLQMVFSHGAKVRLDRSLDYKQSWYLTVDGWRNGKVSNL